MPKRSLDVAECYLLPHQCPTLRSLLSRSLISWSALRQHVQCEWLSRLGGPVCQHVSEGAPSLAGRLLGRANSPRRGLRLPLVSVEATSRFDFSQDAASLQRPVPLKLISNSGASACAGLQYDWRRTRVRSESSGKSCLFEQTSS